MALPGLKPWGPASLEPQSLWAQWNPPKLQKHRCRHTLAPVASIFHTRKPTHRMALQKVSDLAATVFGALALSPLKRVVTQWPDYIWVKPRQVKDQRNFLARPCLPHRDSATMPLEKLRKQDKSAEKSLRFTQPPIRELLCTLFSWVLREAST